MLAKKKLFLEKKTNVPFSVVIDLNNKSTLIINHTRESSQYSIFVFEVDHRTKIMVFTIKCPREC